MDPFAKLVGNVVGKQMKTESYTVLGNKELPPGCSGADAESMLVLVESCHVRIWPFRFDIGVGYSTPTDFETSAGSSAGVTVWHYCDKQAFQKLTEAPAPGLSRAEARTCLAEAARWWHAAKTCQQFRI